MSCFDQSINMDLISICSIAVIFVFFLFSSTFCFASFLDNRRELKIIGIVFCFYVITTTCICVVIGHLNSLMSNNSCGYKNYFETACSNICPNNSKFADEITTYSQEGSYCLKQCYSSNIKLKLYILDQLRRFIFDRLI